MFLEIFGSMLLFSFKLTLIGFSLASMVKILGDKKPQKEGEREERLSSFQVLFILCMLGVFLHFIYIQNKMPGSSMKPQIRFFGTAFMSILLVWLPMLLAFLTFQKGKYTWKSEIIYCSWFVIGLGISYACLFYIPL